MSPIPQIEVLRTSYQKSTVNYSTISTAQVFQTLPLSHRLALPHPNDCHRRRTVCFGSTHLWTSRTCSGYLRFTINSLRVSDSVLLVIVSHRKPRTANMMCLHAWTNKMRLPTNLLKHYLLENLSLFTVFASWLVGALHIKQLTLQPNTMDLLTTITLFRDPLSDSAVKATRNAVRIYCFMEFLPILVG